jgi:hypothetical protein
MDFLNRPENDYCHLFFYIFIYLFSLVLFGLFSPFQQPPILKRGKKRTLFHQLKLSDYEISFYSILSTSPPPSISRFETHNDNFLSPYSFSFGSVSNLSVSPRPVRLNSAFGSDVPLLIEENQDMTHTQ